MWTVTLFALYSWVSTAHADGVGERDAGYREHVRAALVAYDAGDMLEAHAQFEAAHARYPNARTLRGLGTVELEQHEYVAAAVHLEQALASSELPLTGPLRNETEAALDEANAHVGRVMVLSSPADAEVQLDGRVLAAGTPTVLAPGVYTIALSAPGFRPESRQLLLSARQNQLIQWSLQRELPAAASAPPARQVRTPWLLLGAGGTLAATGIALLAVGIHDYRQLDRADSYADWQDRRDRYPKLVGIGGALAGVGALAIATGWWWRAHGRTELWASPNRLLLRTRF